MEHSISALEFTGVSLCGGGLYFVFTKWGFLSQFHPLNKASACWGIPHRACQGGGHNRGEMMPWKEKAVFTRKLSTEDRMWCLMSDQGDLLSVRQGTWQENKEAVFQWQGWKVKDHSRVLLSQFLSRKSIVRQKLMTWVQQTTWLSLGRVQWLLTKPNRDRKKSPARRKF